MEAHFFTQRWSVPPSSPQPVGSAQPPKFQDPGLDGWSQPKFGVCFGGSRRSIERVIHKYSQRSIYICMCMYMCIYIYTRLDLGNVGWTSHVVYYICHYSERLVQTHMNRARAAVSRTKPLWASPALRCTRWCVASRSKTTATQRPQVAAFGTEGLAGAFSVLDAWWVRQKHSPRQKEMVAIKPAGVKSYHCAGFWRLFKHHCAAIFRASFVWAGDNMILDDHCKSTHQDIMWN